MDIELIGIKFKFTDSNGIQNGTSIHLPPSPEWPGNRRSASAITLPQLHENGLNIQVCIEARSDLTIGKYIWLRALLVSGGFSEEGESPELARTDLAFNGSVAWKSPDESYITLSLDHHHLFKDEIGAYNSEWRWEWAPYHPENPPEWEEIGLSQQRIYLLLDTPSSPWRGTGADSPNPPPSVPVVDLACHWAAGTNTPEEAATKITTCLSKCGKLVYQLAAVYMKPAPSDAPQQGASIDPIHLFRLQGFTDLMNGQFGYGPTANCTDFAHMVALLGNAIGCGLKTGVLVNNTEDDSTSFELNSADPPLPTGLDPDFEEPYYSIFTMHEVAYLGDEFDLDARIFDASLSWTEEIEESAGFQLDPVANLPLGDQGEIKGYISRLAEYPEQCSPQEGSDKNVRLI